MERYIRAYSEAADLTPGQAAEQVYAQNHDFSDDYDEGFEDGDAFAQIFRGEGGSVIVTIVIIQTVGLLIYLLATMPK